MRSKMDSCHSTGCVPVVKSKPGLCPAQPFHCSLFQKGHVVISGGVGIVSSSHLSSEGVCDGPGFWFCSMAAWAAYKQDTSHQKWKGNIHKERHKNLPSCVVFHHPSSVSGVRCLVLGSGPSVPAFLQSAVISSLHLLSHLQFNSNSCQLFTQSITWVALKSLKPVTWSAHSFHIISSSAAATLVAFDSHYVISIMETLFPLPGFCFLCVFSWPPPLGFNVVSSQRDIILLHIREIGTDQQILPSPSLFLFHPSNRMPERAVQTAEFRLVEVSG